ncbi:MAG: cobalt chelatase, partial [Rubrivivax sp.]|nr:cobalt chelatase [Rubrivivax sp.]
MGEAQLQARRRQRLDELCAATLRALTGEPRLRFRGHRLCRGNEPLAMPAPHLRADEDADLASLRGIADGMAMRLLVHDAALHGSLAPAHPVEALLFELFEQFRCESLAALPGMRANLRHRHESWSAAFHRSRLTESAAGLALYTVAQVVRSRVSGEPVVEATEDLMEGERARLVPAIGVELAAMRRHRRDQRAYAQPARAVARHVAARVESALAEEDVRSAEGTETSRPPPFALWLDRDDAGDDGSAAVTTGGAREAADGAERYRIFTAAYDREDRAGRLVRTAALGAGRERLDAR